MRKMGSFNRASLFLAFVVAAAAIGVRGQGVPSCASDLVACQNDLNNTSPPAACCDPLKKAVATELNCLCSLFQNVAIFDAFKINRTQALELPKHCGITSDITACNATHTTGSNDTTSGGGGSGGSGNNNNSGASKMALLEMSGLVGLFLLWVSLLA